MVGVADCEVFHVDMLGVDYLGLLPPLRLSSLISRCLFGFFSFNTAVKHITWQTSDVALVTLKLSSHYHKT